VVLGEQRREPDKCYHLESLHASCSCIVLPFSVSGCIIEACSIGAALFVVVALLFVTTTVVLQKALGRIFVMVQL
jgi:hypothetical protein